MLVLIIALIIVIAAIAIYFVSSTPKITMAYSSKYGNTFYSGNNTYILFYLNVTTTKNCQFDFGNLQLTCNDQPISVIVGSGSNIINLQSGQINSIQLNYQVKGNVTGNFQLVYNGSYDVTLNGLPSVEVHN